jgi:predicted nucleic acid-binding protein
MKKYLLDSGIANDFVYLSNGIPLIINDFLTRGIPVGICSPVIAELYAGVEMSTKLETKDGNRRLVSRVLSTLPNWPVSLNACRKFGEIRNDLKLKARHMIF